MWLEATESAWRKPWNPAVALFTASTAASARTVPSRVDALPSADSFRTGVRSWSRTPASITFARRPSARSAGCTFAAVGRRRPPRKTGDAHRVATSSRDSGCASEGAPTASHASTSSSQSPTCAVARRDLQRAARPVARVDSLLGAERADPVDGALGGAAHLDRAGVTDAVAQDRQVVPERRDEAAVPPARPVSREAGLEHDDVEPGLERLQLPRRPEAEVAARRRRPRPRSCRPRAAGWARPAPPPRASSRSACAAWRDPRASSGPCVDRTSAAATGRFPGNRRFPASGILRASHGPALASSRSCRKEYRWRTGLEPATTGITTRGSTN